MKKHIFLLFIVSLCVFAACEQNEVETPIFDISTPKMSYHVKDTVWFNFDGNPDLITFYSGEIGKRYEYVNRTIATGTPKLQFTSVAANGAQTNSLHLMISNDFKGVVVGDEAGTLSNIASATWTDITSRAALSSGTSTASGAIDLSDFAALEKPVYIAFKYTAESGSIQRKWTINGLSVTNTLPDATTYTLANLTATAITNYGNVNTFSPGWVGYNVSNTYGWVITSGSSLVITGATTAAAAIDPAEAWTFSGPIDLNKVSPDLGTYVKGMDTRIGSYYYIYNTAGTYTATLVGATNNTYGQKETVRQVTLTVEP